MNIETANRLLKYRRKSGLSQDALAEKIGVSRQAVSKWERAEASPDTDNLILLAQIYGVTLDELLTGDPDNTVTEEEKAASEEKPIEENPGGDNSPKGDTGSSADGDSRKDEKSVSFKNGIHINDGADRVDVSCKGVHVHSKDGTRVDVDRNGINVVDSNNNKRAYTDSEGNVHIPEKDEYINNRKNRNLALSFPYWLIAVIAFFIFGFFNIAGGWATSWMWFLTIPLYYTTVEAIIKRNFKIFCYPVFVVLVFMLLGMNCGMWHPGWILFLTIPLFYWVASLIQPDADMPKDESSVNSVNTAAPAKKRGVVFTVIVIVLSVILLWVAATVCVYIFADSETVRESYVIKSAYSDNIYVDKTSGDLNIYKTDRENSYVEYTRKTKGIFYGSGKLKITEKENTTTIDTPDEFVFLGVAESSIDLYLTDKEFESLTIDSTSGGTYSKDAVSIKDFIIDTSSGEIKIDNIKADTVDIDISSGDVNVYGEFRNVTVDSSSGNVTIDDKIFLSKLSVDISSGNIEVSIPDSREGFILEYDTSSGDVDTDFPVTENLDDNQGKVVYGKGAGKYKVDMSSGNFELNRNSVIQ